MNLGNLSSIAWEVDRSDYDFHIRLEQDDYVIGVFDSRTERPEEAYLTSHQCETWEQVERYCRDYDGITVL